MWTMRMMMDGNPLEKTTGSGGSNSFCGTESSAKRKKTDGIGKGANWGELKGIIESNVKKTTRGFREKRKRT